VLQRTCSHCDAPFNATHKIQKYCGEKCRDAAKWARSKRVPCSVCGGSTGYKTTQAKTATHNACMKQQVRHGTHSAYRDRRCRCDICTQWARDAVKAYRLHRASTPEGRPTCTVPDCGRVDLAGRGMCKMHYRRWERANGRTSPSDDWRHPTRIAHRARRDAIKRGATTSELFTLDDVTARDGYACGICTKPVPHAHGPPTSTVTVA
jgi:hypothetical protein